MSLMIQAYLLEKYGPSLSMEQLGPLLGIAAQTASNKASAGTLGIPTDLRGGKRWADYRDIAAYFDERRQAAHHDLGR